MVAAGNDLELELKSAEDTMYILGTGTIDTEVNIFEEAEKSVEKHERFLRKTEIFVRRMNCGVSVTAKTLSKSALPTGRGVRIQLNSGGWVDIVADMDGFSVQRSCGFHFARPWYPNEDSFSHVKKAIGNFVRN